MTVILQDSQTQADAYAYWQDFGAGAKRYAQTFTAQHSYYLKYTNLYIWGAGRSVTVHIHETVDGIPHGDPIASSSITMPSPDDWSWQVMPDFSPEVILGAGTKYAIEVILNDGSYFGWCRKNSDVYAGGNPYWSSDGTDESWNEISGYDACFELYGETVTAYERTSAVYIGNSAYANRISNVIKQFSSYISSYISASESFAVGRGYSLTNEGIQETVRLLIGEPASCIKSICCLESPCTADEDQTSSSITKSTKSGFGLVDANSVKTVKTDADNDTIQVDHIFTALEDADIKGFGVFNDDNDILYSLCCYAATFHIRTDDVVTIQMKMQIKG